MPEDAAIDIETELSPIPLAAMQPGTLAPVDLYLISGTPARAVLYKTAHSPLTEEVRARLVENGVTQLSVHKKDSGVYKDYVEDNIETILRDEQLDEGEAGKIVYEASSRVMLDTFKNPSSGRNVQRAHKMVKATVFSILKDPDALWRMTSIASHDYCTYTHCVHVCMFLVTACRVVLGIEDKGLLEQIGRGGLLHDIGKSGIPEKILKKPGKLTAEEFEVIKTHPQLGVQIAAAHKVSVGALDIVASHHEHFDGGGYPQGLAGVLTVCEMEGHFDNPLLRSFVRFLGPQNTRSELLKRLKKGAPDPSPRSRQPESLPAAAARAASA